MMISGMSQLFFLAIGTGEQRKQVVLWHAGGIVGSLFGLESASMTGLTISSFFLFSLAQYHGYLFLGLFGLWIPLDPRLFVFWAVAHSSWALKLAQQILGRDFGSLRWVQQNLQNPGWLWQTIQRFLQQQV